MNLTAVLDAIVSRITSYKKPAKILLFGSRARNEGTAVSDIDVAIVDPDWTRKDIALVHDRLEEEVRTPLKIDVLAYHLVSKQALKHRILAEGKVLYERYPDQLP